MFGRETWSGSRAPRVEADPPWRIQPSSGCGCYDGLYVPLRKSSVPLQPMAVDACTDSGMKQVKEAAGKF